MRVLCSICARGGSTSLKNKNIKNLHGAPLIVHTLLTAKRSKLFDKLVVSSDSSKILKISKNFSDFNIKRPNKLSHDSAPKINAIKHALIQSENNFKEKFDVIFDLDATSPLREVKDLLNAFKIFKRGNYPNLVSVCISNKNPYYNMIEKNKKEVKIVKKTKFNIYNRQEAPKIYDVNASIYIWKRSSLLKSKNIINSNTGLYVMPKSRSIDIDDIDDFELVKYYMEKKER